MITVNNKKIKKNKIETEIEMKHLFIEESFSNKKISNKKQKLEYD